MNNHFCPRPSQRNDKTGAHDKKESPKQREESPYVVRWWRRTKRSELTGIFYISFRVENDPVLVCDLVKGEFGECVSKIINWEYWYEIQLIDHLSWGEIIGRVDKAFTGVFK